MRRPELIDARRRRRIPSHFSWVDHRLVRDGHMQACSTSALALYLFLVTVADAEGLSWYSDAALCRELSWSPAQLSTARAELKQAGLLAYQRPLYQVLDLNPEAGAGGLRHSGGARSIGEILGLANGGGQ